MYTIIPKVSCSCLVSLIDTIADGGPNGVPFENIVFDRLRIALEQILTGYNQEFPSRYDSSMEAMATGTESWTEHTALGPGSYSDEERTLENRKRRDCRPPLSITPDSKRLGWNYFYIPSWSS
jgi:hypothetical protein